MNTAVILGAGSGSRMKSRKNKLLLEINGKTVLQMSIEAFLDIEEIDEILVTAREEDLDEYISLFDYDKVTFVIGGETRQKSVKNAVEVIDESEIIIIHDGARPFVSRKEILDTLAAAREHKAAAVGVPVKDTIKIIEGDNFVVSTPDRKSLFAVRTPQAFDFELYKSALKMAEDENRDFTDDCAVVENYGGKVKMVEGSYSNIKITTPDDLAAAQIIASKLRKEEKI